jgi:hypothetical protein
MLAPQQEVESWLGQATSQPLIGFVGLLASYLILFPIVNEFDACRSIQ